MKTVTTVLIDFGGVIAEEGFREGLREIGRRNGLDPDGFFQVADRLISTTGYLTGMTDETAFWEAVRGETGIQETDSALRDEILRRFTLRPAMLAWLDRLRAGGITVAILSDQTNWLEEIDADTGLFQRVDRVFNSFRFGKSKRDASFFDDVCAALGANPRNTLFVDDNPSHIERAAARGLLTILYTDTADFERRLRSLIQTFSD
jgi:putative hydrolase of the HAD superfamily